VTLCSIVRTTYSSRPAVPVLWLAVGLNAHPQVENILFRVHRAIFDQSEVFQDMFRVPGSGDAVTDGTDDEHPLILHGYTAEDFRQLLKVTMPLYVLALSMT
jgi:hypothetical protein